MSMNGARVIGPALGGWLTSRFGFAEVFSLNAVTYLFVLVAIVLTTIPPTSADPRNLGDRLFGGFRIAFRAPQVGRPLTLMCLFSFFCLPFIGQLPAIAEIEYRCEGHAIWLVLCHVWLWSTIWGCTCWDCSSSNSAEFLNQVIFVLVLE